MKRLALGLIIYRAFIPLSYGMDCGAKLATDNFDVQVKELFTLEDQRASLVNRHWLLNPKYPVDFYQDKLGSPVILPGDVALDPDFIAQQLSLDTFKFDFKAQEEIRYFLVKKFKPEWFGKGKSLLASLATNEKKRAELSEDDRLLADSTLLYLQYEDVFNRNLIQEESIRAARTIVLYNLAKLESEIDARREKVGLPAIDKPVKESSRRKPEQFYAEAEAATKLYLQAQADVQEWQKTLKSLREQSTYPASIFNSDFYLFKEAEFWKQLGYDSRPVN